MAEIQIKKDTTIYHKDTPVRAVGILIEAGFHEACTW